MPIYFRNAPVREPFIYDSIGNHWLQDATSRPNGYPFYHYLQTESGCGRITIQGKSYLLHEQEGVLIAPSHLTHLSGPNSGVVHLLLYLFRNSRRQYFQNPEQPADSFYHKRAMSEYTRAAAGCHTAFRTFSGQHPGTLRQLLSGAFTVCGCPGRTEASF